MADPAPRRLYMDNAATSFPKPPAVLEAMVRYATDVGGSAGRGGYREATESAAILLECRRKLCRLFHGEKPEQFIFTLNCTDALNLAIKGLIDPDRPARANHAICTAIDHNSVLRPLNALTERGWVNPAHVPVDPKTGLVDPADIAAAIRPETRLIAVTHVSNVTGTLQPIAEIGAIARHNGIPFIVDAAQSVGHLDIDVQRDNIDLLAAPGHKGLLGPLGTGFLYIRPGIEAILRPLKEGGTGSVSEEARQPDFMPDKYETGSHNAIGIAGLLEGVKWVLDQGTQKLTNHDRGLVATFLESLDSIDGLTYYGPHGVAHRTGVFSVRIEGYEPQELSAILESRYGILTRSGVHCAPMIHQTLGTLERGGTTRFSFGPFLSVQDVSYASDALAEIAAHRPAMV